MLGVATNSNVLYHQKNCFESPWSASRKTCWRIRIKQHAAPRSNAKPISCLGLSNKKGFVLNCSSKISTYSKFQNMLMWGLTPYWGIRLIWETKKTQLQRHCWSQAQNWCGCLTNWSGCIWFLGLKSHYIFFFQHLFLRRHTHFPNWKFGQ